MKNLRTLRKQRNLKEKDIAQLLNVSESAISQYETGNREANHTSLKILANFFNTTTDYLLGRTEDPQSVIYEDSNNILIIKNKSKREVYNLSTENMEFIFKLISSLTRKNTLHYSIN